MEILLFMSIQWPCLYIPPEGFQTFAKSPGPTFWNYFVPFLCKYLVGIPRLEEANPFVMCFATSDLAQFLAQNAHYKDCWRDECEEILLFIFSNCGITWFKVFCCFKINFLNEKFSILLFTQSEKNAILCALLKYVYEHILC